MIRVMAMSRCPLTRPRLCGIKWPPAEARLGGDPVARIPTGTKKVVKIPDKPSTTQSKDVLDRVGLDEICEHIAEGKSYRALCAKYGVSMGGLTRWLGADPERVLACASARQIASQAWDELATEEVRNAADPLALAKARELAIHYRWRSKAVNPKAYGDKMQAEVEVKQTLDDVDARIASVLGKLNGERGGRV